MPKGLHTIRSLRYDSRKEEVKLYTTCGRIVISASDAGILVKFRPHVNKIVVDMTRWQPAPTAKVPCPEAPRVAPPIAPCAAIAEAA